MRVFGLLSFIFILFSGFSQQYNFIEYTVEDGLAQNQVYSILQDQQGYLWMATTGGVSRFDGHEFINYTQRDGLIKNHVYELYLDEEGNIWMGCVGGISKWDGKKFHNYFFPPSLVNNRTTSITRDHKNRLWIGTNGGGLLELKDNVFYSYENEIAIPSNFINALFFDKENTLWIGTKEGLSLMKDEGFQKSEFLELNSVYVSHLTEGKKGEIIVSTFGEGSFLIKNNIKQISVSDGITTDWIRKMVYHDSLGYVMASKFGLSFLLSSGKTINISEQNGLEFTDIKNIFIDNESNLWLATNGVGALKFSGLAFQNYTVQDGLPANEILSIQQLSNGDMLLGTLRNGLCIRKNDSCKHLYDELSNPTVWSILPEKDNIWLATSQGITLLKNGKSDFFVHNDSDKTSLADNRVTAIFKDKKNQIWFGHREGISKYNNGKFENYGYQDGFTGMNIRTILEDNKGNLLCGAEDGIYLFNPHTKHSEKIEVGDNIDKKVFCLSKDKYGKIWIGTDNGLYRKDGDKFHFISLGEDSRRNFINFLQLEGKNKLWIGTNYGVYCLEIKEETESDPKVKTFTSHEGIKNLECNLNASFIDSEGHLWFGTAGSLVKLDSDLLKDDEAENHQVDIRKLTINYDRQLSADELKNGLRLKPNENRLVFDFIKMCFSNPENVSYSFRLKGWDEKWSPLSKTSQAVFSNLPSGEYEFEVKAMDKNGNWTNISRLSFTILTPFYKRWWFIGLMTSLALFIIYIVYRWRLIEKEKKLQSEKLSYQNKLLELEHQSLNASMNRHFIFNALNSIQYYINRQDRISANRYLSSFAKLIRKNLDSSAESGNIVSLAEEMERIELYLQLEHMRFNNKFEFFIEEEGIIDKESINVPAMLLQPFIENSIWHGILPKKNEGKIWLKLTEQKNGIHFLIKDNGIGIEASKEERKKSVDVHDSKGMKITYGRVALLKKITGQKILLKGPYDWKDKDGNIGGAEVNIFIPFT